MLDMGNVSISLCFMLLLMCTLEPKSHCCISAASQIQSVMFHIELRSEICIQQLMNTLCINDMQIDAN